MPIRKAIGCKEGWREFVTSRHFLAFHGKLAYIANDYPEALMATRNIVLTESQSLLVDQLVATGRFQNASEALRAGLRLLEREETELGETRERLRRGVEEARAGYLAEGSGEHAVRRAFRAARDKS
jgi:antitoxin ParD1/3/4